MMSNRSKSNGVVVKVSVITEGDAKVNIQCDELKDCQDMYITEGNVQPTGLTDCFDIRTKKSSMAISVMLSTLLAVVISVGIKVAFPEVDPQMIGGMSMIGFCVSLLVQQWMHSRSLTLSTLLAVVIIVGMKITYPEVDLLMIGCTAMIGFCISLLVQQWFKPQCLSFLEFPNQETNCLVTEEPNCPRDEIITEEDINSCPGEILGTESTTASTPIKLMEVRTNTGQATLIKCKTETLEEAEELATKQFEEEMALKKTDYPITIREVKRSHALKIILEGQGKPDCPEDENTIVYEGEKPEVNTQGEAGEEEAITLCEERENQMNPVKKSHKVIERRSEQQIAEYGPPEEQNPTCKVVEEPTFPRDETITYEEVPPIKIREYERKHASQIILERKPDCLGDEEPVCEDQGKPGCPEDETTIVCEEEKPEVNTTPSSPVTLKEVTSNKGKVTIYKSKNKKWNPFKRSNKVVERRSEQQIAEYGPPEEQNPTCEVVEEPTFKEVEEITFKEVEEPICEVVEEPTCKKVEEEPTCKKVEEEPTKICEDLPRTKNQLRVALHAKSFIFSTLLAVVIFVGVKIAFPEVDLQMIVGMSMIGFLVSLLVHQWFISNNSECCHCHVLSGEECTCHTLFGIYLGLLI